MLTFEVQYGRKFLNLLITLIWIVGANVDYFDHVDPTCFLTFGLCIHPDTLTMWMVIIHSVIIEDGYKLVNNNTSILRIVEDHLNYNLI